MATRSLDRFTTPGGLAIAALTLFAASSPTSAVAAPILQDYLFNVNGTASCPDSVCTSALPASGLDAGAFDFASGIGTLTFTLDAAASGTYFVDAFFDQALHAPFFDEFGTTNGAASAGQSWQIDEPGFGDGNRLGTIFDNALAGTLDDTNHVPGTLSNFLGDCGANGGGAPNAACNNDVSMAMAFNVALAAGDEAIVTLVLSSTAPVGGFFLGQHDPSDPGNNVYLSGAVDVKPVPEPPAALLLGTGLAAMLARKVRDARAVRR